MVAALERAATLVELYRFDEAIGFAGQVGTNPASVAAWELIAPAELGAERAGRAKAAAGEALGLDPGIPRAMLLTALARSGQGGERGAWPAGAVDRG